MTTSLLSYVSSATVAIALGGIVVAVLYRPLFAVIQDLCGTRQRAVFWSIYLSTILILVPVLGVTYISSFGRAMPDMSAFLQRSIFFALLGITGALVGIGWGIWSPSRKLVGRQEATPKTALPEGDQKTANS